ncbi:MAG: SH3 domain-containing protein [Chitinivibrionia bacterium]|nr:SH3 domain-containing protein [Chitinivibrionia bacterium]
MKFVILCLIAVFLFASTSFARQFFASANDDLFVFADTVRKEIENSIEIIASGQNMRVVEEANGWYRVRTENGNEGWVESRFTTEIVRRVFTFDNVEITSFRYSDRCEMVIRERPVENGEKK